MHLAFALLLFVSIVLGKEYVIRLPEGTSPEQVATEEGLLLVRELDHLRGYFLFEGERNAGKQATNYDFIEEQVKTQKYKRGNDPLYPYQWHLNVPVSIERYAWNMSITGQGVTIGVVDDAVQHTHPDLAHAYRAALSHDFNDEDSDPAPYYESDSHGTSVAGIALASRDDGSCGAGVAPQASLAGLRLIAAPFSDLTESEASSHQMHNIDIYSNSWGPQDDGKTLAGPGSLSQLARSIAVQHGRHGKGNVYVWAAGNGRRNGDNCNYDGWANSRFSITVAAVSFNERVSWYSEPCAAVLISAPSSGEGRGIITSDLMGIYGGDRSDCRPEFGGTSAATPYISGVVALLLQANPALGWRDVQGILVESARFPANGSRNGWVQNGAGHLVSHDYGFGIVNVETALTLARNWIIFEPKEQINVNRRGPLSNEPISRHWKRSHVSVSEELIIEHVEIRVVAIHPRRGDLEFAIESPSGTRSILASEHGDDAPDYRWTFGSVQQWGESSQGDWTFHFVDRNVGRGNLHSWELRLYGRLADEWSKSKKI